MSRTQRWALGGGVVFLLQCFWFRRYQVDDAFITYRYAHNWASGLGPVMNAGERVEGVSNLPWTAVLALMKLVGLEPHVVAPLLGTLCGLICVGLTTHLGRQWAKQKHTDNGPRTGGPGTSAPRNGNTAGVLLACCAPMAIWSVSGMETLLYTSLVTLFLFLGTHDQWQRRSVLLGILLAVVASMRPEGILLLLAWMLSAFLVTSWRKQLPAVLLGFTLLAIPLVGLRMWFYGDWVANTVHAKSSLVPTYWIPGLAYGAKALVLALPLWGLAWYGWRALAHSRVAALALAWILLQFSFMVAVGGERFPGYRFLVPMLPVLAALALQAPSAPAVAPATVQFVARRALWALGCLIGLILVWKPDILHAVVESIAGHMRLQQSVLHHQARLLAEVRFLGLALLAATLTDLARVLRPRVAFAVAAAWLLIAAFVDDSLRVCRRPDSAAYHGRLVGEWLRQVAPAGTLVATNSAGALPYFSGLPVIDMLGLTDAHIARSSADRRQWIGHERGDGHYVLQRRPDIVILGGAEGSASPWAFPGDQQLADSDEFQQRFEPQRVALSGFDFTYYRARDGRMPPAGESGRPAERLLP